MTIKLHEIRPVKLAHDRLIDSAERVRVKISSLTNSAIDTTAVIAELSIMADRVQDLERIVRETYNRHG